MDVRPPNLAQACLRGDGVARGAQNVDQRAVADVQPNRSFNTSLNRASGTPETSKPQLWRANADTMSSELGFGWSGRCAPACGLALALGVDGFDFFCPFEGGTLELSVVFGGKPSLASSSESRAVKAAT